MALGFTPVVELYGTNAALFNERLLEWEHTDAAGFVSDQLKLTLDIEGLEGLPDLGGKIGLRIGYLESGQPWADNPGCAVSSTDHSVRFFTACGA